MYLIRFLAIRFHDDWRSFLRDGIMVLTSLGPCICSICTPYIVEQAELCTVVWFWRWRAEHTHTHTMLTRSIGIGCQLLDKPTFFTSETCALLAAGTHRLVITAPAHLFPRDLVF
jgi:hypothetical protein